MISQAETDHDFQKRNEVKQFMQPGNLVIIYLGEEHWHEAALS